MAKRSYVSTPQTECESGAPKCLCEAERKALKTLRAQVTKAIPPDLFYEEAVARLSDGQKGRKVTIVTTEDGARLLAWALARAGGM